MHSITLGAYWFCYHTILTPSTPTWRLHGALWIPGRTCPFLFLMKNYPGNETSPVHCQCVLHWFTISSSGLQWSCSLIPSMPLSKDLDKLNSTALEMLTGELPGLPPTLSFRALLGVKDADPRAVDCNRGRGLVNLLLRNELQGYSTSLMPKHPST